jgi:hypothetical protein
MQAERTRTVTDRQVEAAEKLALVVSRTSEDPSEAVVLRRVASTLGVKVDSFNRHDRQVIWQAYRESWADFAVGGRS